MGEIPEIYRTTSERLMSASPQEMVINWQISLVNYSRLCVEGAVVEAYLWYGVNVAPGMKIQYVITGARKYQAEPEWCVKTFDCQYYQELIDTACDEVAFAFKRERNGIGRLDDAPTLSMLEGSL